MKSVGTFSILVVSTALFSIGCDAPTKSSSHSYGSIGWKSSVKDFVPGIDQAMIRWYEVDGDVIYVVWTDLPGGGGTSGGSSGGGTRERESHVTSVNLSDGSQFEFEYRLDLSDPDATGRLKIANMSFDTRRGGLMMVSTKGGTTEVRQAEIPPSLASILNDEMRTRESLRDELQRLARDENPFKSYFENETRISESE